MRIGGIRVQNAFNSASWEHVDEAHRRRGIPHYLLKIVGSYIEKSTLNIRTSDGNSTDRPVTVLGPTLWYVFYDDILRMSIQVRLSALQMT